MFTSFLFIQRVNPVIAAGCTVVVIEGGVGVESAVIKCHQNELKLFIRPFFGFISKLDILRFGIDLVKYEFFFDLEGRADPCITKLSAPFIARLDSLFLIYPVQSPCQHMESSVF